MKIVYTYPTSNEKAFLKERLPKDIEIITRIQGEPSEYSSPSEDPEIIKEAQSADIIMGPYVTEEMLAKAMPSDGGKLKLVIIPWTGVDSVDFELINKYKVPIANSHANSTTIAEFALTLLLAASKNLIHHDTLLRKGDWSSRFSDRPSKLIRGKTVGLLGYGAIGLDCAKLLQPFGVELIALRRDPSKSTDEEKSIVKTIYSINELSTFLQESDIIINSLPLTESTEGMLGEKEFKQMKDDVVLVNVGRGKTIDEKALFDALKEGKLFAAGLDPQWEYPSRGSDSESEITYPSNYPLHEFDNIVLSPHRAADIEGGYIMYHYADVIENIMRIYEGKEPINLIDLERGY
ncbi:MAG: 2-hydroxyacid dehydrogenase [Candidatus Heimdallarchaeota archaeon]